MADNDNNVTVVGRVRPGQVQDYDAAKAYDILDRVRLDGAVYECCQACAAGEGPAQAPARWLVLDAGLKPADVSELRSRVAATLQNIKGEKTFYVGGDNASDTADLGNGRGETAAMPFATFDAACQHIANNYAGAAATVVIVLQADAECNANLFFKNFHQVKITSDSTRRTLKLNQHYQGLEGNIELNNITVANGDDSFTAKRCLQLSNAGCRLTLRNTKLINLDYVEARGNLASIWLGPDVEFEMDSRVSSRAFSLSNGGALLSEWTASITFNGSVSYCVVEASSGSFCSFDYCEISGTVTGKKYNALKFGRIYLGKTEDRDIPGTIAGTCDTTSECV